MLKRAAVAVFVAVQECDATTATSYYYSLVQRCILYFAPLLVTHFTLVLPDQNLKYEAHTNGGSENTIPKNKTEIDKAVIDVLESSAYINGKPVHEFCANLAQYLSVKHVIPCANGTDALQIAMMALGLEPGDEVITPSFTYIATTEVVALLRLKPVFVEVDAKTFCMDAEALRKAITTKTKAIVPVHLYGQAANMEEIMKVAGEHNIAVIEDNAQAIGCDYTFSDGAKRRRAQSERLAPPRSFRQKPGRVWGRRSYFTNDDALAKKNDDDSQPWPE